MAVADTLVLRTATVADAALVAGMHATSRTSAFRGMLPDEYLDHGVPIEAAAHWPVWLQQLQSGSGEVLIAERDRQPIGFMCLEVPDETHSVYVDNLHVLPHCKGSGAGTTMLNAAQQWARARGATGLHLSVLDANLPAAGFYEHRGWQLARREVRKMGGMDVVVRRYELPLDQPAELPR